MSDSRLKFFEIRDKATFMPVVAIRAEPDSPGSDAGEAEWYLLRRAGYGFDDPLVILVLLEEDARAKMASWDPVSWASNGTRTLYVAHSHIQKHWDELKSGAVLDVEFILGETKQPKVSERLNP